MAFTAKIPKLVTLDVPQPVLDALAKKWGEYNDDCKKIRANEWGVWWDDANGSTHLSLWCEAMLTLLGLEQEYKLVPK